MATERRVLERGMAGHANAGRSEIEKADHSVRRERLILDLDSGGRPDYRAPSEDRVVRSQLLPRPLDRLDPRTDLLVSGLSFAGHEHVEVLLYWNEPQMRLKPF